MSRAGDQILNKRVKTELERGAAGTVMDKCVRVNLFWIQWITV